MIKKSGFAVALLVTFVACGGEDKPAQDPSTTSAAKPVDPPMTPPAPPPEVKATVVEAPPAPPAPKPMSDSEILGFIKAANTGEIAMAEIAKKQATKNDVKQFAAMMVTQHTDANNKERELEKKTSMKADESASDTTKLKSDAEGIVAKLKDAKGKDFDGVYMDSQVKAHKDVLDAIDNKLSPAAQNAEVKDYVASIRKHVAEHLTKAEDIQKKLTKTAALPATPPATKGKSNDANPIKQEATDLDKVNAPTKPNGMRSP